MWRNAIAPALVVVLFWLLSSLATTFYVRWLEQSQTILIAEDLSTIQSAGAMRYTLRHLQDTVLAAGHQNSPDALADVDRLCEEFRQHQQEARVTSLTDDERELVDLVGRNFDKYQQEVRRWLGSISATQPATVSSIRRLAQLADSVAEPCKRLSDVNEKLIRDSAAYSRDVGGWMATLRVSFLIVGPAVGILCGYWISRRFHRSMARISVTLDDAASGPDKPLARIDIQPSVSFPRLQEQAQAVASRIGMMVQELQTARQNENAAARLAAVGELAAGVAHEIRNPLTSVKLLVQNAAAKKTESALPRKQLEVIQQEIVRMEETVERLLHFARPPKMKRVPHDLRNTVQRAINLVSGRAAHAGVSIVSQIAVEPVPVVADPDQLHQAVVNLLINALDAMPSGGELRVIVGCSASNPRCCQIVVQDTGTGIPAEFIDRIFEPFVTGKERGTGLGLAISRRIVIDTGGTLQAVNCTPHGAALTVELPLHREVSGAGALLPASEPSRELHNAQVADS